MKNGKVFYNNQFNSAVIAVSSQASGFGCEYLGNSNQGVVWRSTTPTNQWLSMTFQEEESQGGNPVIVPVPTAVKGIVVLNHNMVTGDSFLFEAANVANFSTKVSVPVPTAIGYVEVDWNYPYYRLSMSKVNGDYVQVGEVYLLGGVYQFETNFKWNYSYTREINRNVKQTTSGQVYRRTRFIRRGYDLEFQGLTDTQKQVFEAISESDYICFMPYGSDGELYYGVIDLSSFTHVYNDYWNVNFTFMENPR